MADDERDRICQAWITYKKNWWAYSTVDKLVSENDDEAWPTILRMIDLADSDELIGDIGAGPLEDLLSKHGPQIIDQVKSELSRNERLRAALKHVWLAPAENEAVDELLSLGCHSFQETAMPTPNPALNTDAHRRAFSPPAVSG